MNISTSLLVKLRRLVTIGLLFTAFFLFFFATPFSVKKVYAVDVNDYTHMIANECPNISTDAIRSALTAYDSAVERGIPNKPILTIVDYTKPSNDKRLCTVDLTDADIMYNGYVAHGVHSGGLYATQFSNKVNSHETSLGLFKTGQPYYGKAGYSLHLKGLDKGLNNNVAERHVVLHGTPHATEQYVATHGHTGHSLGCFAMNKNHAKQLINEVKGGSMLFAYYPSPKLEDSSFLS